MLRHRHHDAVAGADVVQQEIAERVERLRAERRRDRERAAVDRGAGGGGRQGADVTDSAPDPVEQSRPALRLRGRGEQRVARGSFRGPDKAGEAVHIRQPIGARRIVGLGGGVAAIRDFVGEEPSGDPHFVQVRVARKRQQTGMLILPAEPPHPRLPGRLDDGHVQRLAADLAVGGPALRAGDPAQRLVGHRFHEAVAQEIE